MGHDGYAGLRSIETPVVVLEPRGSRLMCVRSFPRAHWLPRRDNARREHSSRSRLSSG